MKQLRLQTVILIGSNSKKTGRYHFRLDDAAPDGLTICRSLRSGEDTKYIPILLLTAWGAEVDKVLGLEMGADDYIVKPFGVKKFAHVYARYCVVRKIKLRPSKKKN
ncbi:MAG: response regulator [Acutalibacteraceae bacterium]